ncbi:MAG: EFR1 family ferrodoxin [Sarcina sp.]
MKSEIYFFSGTGNSHYVAKTLGFGLENSKLIHIGGLDLSNEIKSDANVIGIVFPTYFYDAPDIIKNFIKKLNVEKSTYIFIYQTCGGNVGNSSYTCNSLLKEKNLKLANHFSIKMPDNCVLFSSIEEENQKLLDSALKKINQDLMQIQNFKTKVANKPKFKYKVIGSSSLKNVCISFMKFKNFKVNEDKCTSCKICKKVCPIGNIEFVNGQKIPKFKEKCEMCFACIHYCPNSCIKHGMMKKKENYQYHNPNISMIEVINKKKHLD